MSGRSEKVGSIRVGSKRVWHGEAGVRGGEVGSGRESVGCDSGEVERESGSESVECKVGG